MTVSSGGTHSSRCLSSHGPGLSVSARGRAPSPSTDSLPGIDEISTATSLVVPLVVVVVVVVAMAAGLREGDVGDDDRAGVSARATGDTATFATGEHDTQRRHALVALAAA